MKASRIIKSRWWWLILLLLAFFPLLKTLYLKKDYYLSAYDHEFYRSHYEISQYVKEKGAAWIPDEFLFAYASYEYVQGANPILLNPENPPLGKYLIGLSIKYLGNEKIPTAVFGFLSLLSVYLLGRLFFRSAWLAWLPVVLFVWGRLYQEQLIYLPLFELFALTFLYLSFYFFLKADDDWRYFWLSSSFLGFLVSTRPWMAVAPVLFMMAIYLCLKRNKRAVLSWIVSLILLPVVLIFTYSRLFLEGWSIYRILSVQKWILWYHRSRVIKLGSVWPFIFLNRWYVWWGEQKWQKIEQWRLFWPLFTTLSLFSFYHFFKLIRKRQWQIDFPKKSMKYMVFLNLWIVAYLLFLSVGNINARYLFYLLPSLYLSGVYIILLLFKKDVVA